MELEPGYTQTEVGVIPRDWSLRKLQDIVIDNRIPSGLYRSKGLYGRGTKIIKIGDVFGEDYFLPDLAQRVELTNEEISNCGVKVGDIIIALASVKLEGVGKVMLVNILDEDTVFDHNVALIRLNRDVDSEYIFHLFKSALVRKLVGSRATQVGTTFLKTSTILGFPIPLPPTRIEQRAIATALSDVDALINSLDRLIAKKRDIKQAAMQELLTGKKRLPGFNGEWEVKRLSEIFQFLNTANNPRSDLSDNGEVMYVHYGDIHTRWKSFLDCANEYLPSIRKDKVRSVPFLEDGDLIMVDASEDYTGTGVSVEVKNVDDRKIVAGLHTLLLRGNKEVLADGFKGYIQYIPTLKQALIQIATGVSVYGISKNNIKDIALRIPSVLEQRAIATMLSDRDAEITALEQRRDKTRALKQGMMQELLTGRIRLHLDLKD